MAPKARLGSKARKVAGCWRSLKADERKGYGEGQHVAVACSHISLKMGDGGPVRGDVLQMMLLHIWLGNQGPRPNRFQDNEVSIVLIQAFGQLQSTSC